MTRPSPFPPDGDASPDPTPTQKRPLSRLGGGRKLLVAAVLLATFGTGAGADQLLSHGGLGAGASSSMTDVKEFATLQQTWDLVHDNYADPAAIDNQALIYGAAKGMVEALGDTGHSTFLTPEEAKAFDESTKGELIGIGVQLDFTSGRPIVVAPIDGSPADKAHVRSGDVIAQIDSVDTSGLSQTQISKSIRGDAGTTVKLTFERPSDQTTFSVELTRAKITLKPVSWAMLPGNVAHIRLSEFSTGATQDLKAALGEARNRGATSIIFDLRDNPGGLVFEAIGVASQFLPEGTTIYQYQERGSDARPVKTTGIGSATDLPMVVLVSNGSASAAEIVSAALKESGRAALIGERTFGTGTVLVPYQLKDGATLVLGTALWLAPSGERFWHKGVTPTTTVALPKGVQMSRPGDEAKLDANSFGLTTDVQLKAAHDQLVPAKK